MCGYVQFLYFSPVHGAILDLALKLLLFIVKFFSGPLSHRSQCYKQYRIITCGVCVILVNISVLCMLVCMCMCAFVCKEGYIYVWTSNVYYIMLYFWNKVSHKNWGLTIFLEWLTDKPWEGSCLCLLSSGITVADKDFCECSRA